MALFMRYLENVRSHCRRDVQSKIACGRIDLVQQLILLGKSSVESSTLTVKPLEGGAASLNPVDRAERPLSWEEAAPNEGLVKFLGRDNM